MAGFVDNMAGVGFEHTPGPFAQFDDMQLMEMYMDGTLPAEQRIAIRAELRKRDEARLPREPSVQTGPQPLGMAPGWLADAGPMIEQPTLDPSRRKGVKNADGTFSTIESMSVNIDGEEVLIPTITEDGQRLSEQEAIARYLRTGEHLGKFDSPESATQYAKELSNLQGQRGAERGTLQGMVAPAGPVAPLGANELSSVPASTLAPPPMGQGMAGEPPVQDVIPAMQQMADALSNEDKERMLDGMVKMLDTLVVEGEAPAERQEAVSRSAGDQRSEQPAPTSAGPAKPENAPDERTLALAQVYEVAAATGLVTPESMPFRKFVESFDMMQGGSPKDDQMARLMAKGEEKKAEFTEEEAPKKELRKPSDVDEQMRKLGGFAASEQGRTGA